MKNWKTNASGWIGIIMAVLGIVSKLLNGDTISGEDVTILGGILSTGTGLLFAKDASTPVTTVTQKVEPVGPATIEKTL